MNTTITLPLKIIVIVSIVTACTTPATTAPTAPYSDTLGSLRQMQQAAGAAQTLQSGGLTDLLMQRVGVSQTQAQGGAGALLQLAKNQMQASAFSQLEQKVPGISSLLGAAQPLQNSSALGGLGGLASSAGLGGGSGGTLLGLASAFQQQGMSPSMITQFIPVIVEYVKGSGGTGLANSLSSALIGR